MFFPKVFSVFQMNLKDNVVPNTYFVKVLPDSMKDIPKEFRLDHLKAKPATDEDLVVPEYSD